MSATRKLSCRTTLLAWRRSARKTGFSATTINPVEFELAEKPCRLRRSTQHLLAVYLPESGSPRSFWDVDSSAARPGRVALVRWGPGRFLGGSIVSTTDWCFHCCRAATDSAGRKSTLSHWWPP